MTKKGKVKYILFYGISLGFFFLYFFIILKNKVLDYKGNINPIPILVVTILFVFFSYIANYIYAKTKETTKNMYWNIVVYFFMYILLVFLFTGRNLSFSIKSIEDISFNLIPFKEIISTFVSNDYGSFALLVGNLLLLSPCAILLPRTIKFTTKFFPYFICILLFAFFIEFIQSFFGVGVFDIDDILLNVSGALVLFFPFNKTSLSRITNKVLLLKEEVISKKDILKNTTILGILLVCFVLCLYYYYYKTPGIEIEWMIQSNKCLEKRTLLYEDWLNYYYYSCGNIEDIYLLIDNKKKIKLEDILKGKVPKRYKNYLSSAIIKTMPNIEVVNKYKTIEVSADANTNIRANLEKDGVVALQDGKQSTSADERTLSYVLYPLAEGKVELYFDFYDLETQEITKKVRYQIEVNKDHEVSYEEIK